MPITPAAKKCKKKERKIRMMLQAGILIVGSSSGKRSRLVCGRVCKHSKKV